MPKVQFILQGFTTHTHGAALRDLFGIPGIENVVLNVAYVKESGVEEIESELRANASSTTVFAGVRNDITSYQGLVRLHKIRALKLYVVDTGSRHVVFHPKLYLVRGKVESRIVVGSANLTLGGLNNNIEASVVLGFDETDARQFVSAIEAELIALTTDYPSHVVQITRVRQLDEMLEDGRLVDELAISPPRRILPVQRLTTATDKVVPIRLKVPRLHRKLRPVPARPKTPGRSSRVGPRKRLQPKSVPAGAGFELVWESAPLKERDLTIPKFAGTHSTGSVNLDKGLLTDDVKFQHYFRENVFARLDWRPRSATVDEASAKFRLVIKGLDYGEFHLAIRHSTSTTSRTYEEGNAMSRLSWGPARKLIARRDLLGRTLALYRDKSDPTRFLLEID